MLMCTLHRLESVCVCDQINVHVGMGLILSHIGYISYSTPDTSRTLEQERGQAQPSPGDFDTRPLAGRSAMHCGFSSLRRDSLYHVGKETGNCSILQM
ncbi:hypothetical protein PoB_004309400 [Plakobranchus ocellatus]|uniref:Uncharacterized protein n=1 Tax=Plakobranchus ocellatus TaxID=259542 RepID=A0AAV4BDZ7_9GAST|nr:hypothetical protein PoB_004309400 [Plakobranchus ocellatus]